MDELSFSLKLMVMREYLINFVCTEFVFRLEGIAEGRHLRGSFT